ncbi:MAG: POTRA domain-containing protein, partial [Bacteroidota bacterium]
AMLNASFQRLLEKGYAFLEYRIEQILIDTVKKNAVSVIRMLNPEQYKINAITFEHNTNGGNILKDDLLQQLLFIKPNDWLSPQAVNRSKNQLIGLSFFSEVSESKKKLITSTDTLANVSYLLKYKKP